MKRSTRSLLFTGLMLALLAISTLGVMAKELGKMTISGPGIKGEMTLDKLDETGKIEDTGFFVSSESVKAPENLGTPYHITAYLNLDWKEVPFVRMEYYPAGPKERGYVHYTGRLDGDSLREVDQWAIPPARGESAFRSVMKGRGVTVQVAVPAPAVAEVAPAVEAAGPRPATTTGAPAPALYIAALAAVILAIAGAALLRGRKLRESR